jgi:hypothetical protein
MEDEFAAGGGLGRLLEVTKRDAALGQAGDGVDQMPQGAAEAVELPDDQGVAGTELVQELAVGGQSLRAPLAVSVNTRQQPVRSRASTWSWGCWSVVEALA